MKKTIALLIFVFLLSCLAKSEAQTDSSDYIQLTEETFMDEWGVYTNNKIKVSLQLPTPSYVKIYSQKWWLKQGLSSLLHFGAGYSYGINQKIRHHYSQFAEKYPNHDPDFWGPEQWYNKWKLDSEGNLIPNVDRKYFWQPKYEEKFWGSSRWFVDVTDGHHSTMAGYRLGTMAGVAVSIANIEPQHFVYYLTQLGWSFLCNSAGFYMAHDYGY